jgi:hypothetical protein
MASLAVVPLTSDEKTLKAECEQAIEEGLAAYYVMGIALARINALRLYRDEYPTFSDYCRVRWHVSDKHAYRLIEAAEAHRNLLPLGDSAALPATEYAMRPLAGLPSPEAQQAAWLLIKDTAPDGKITHEHVKSVAAVMQELLDTQAVEVDQEGQAIGITYALDDGTGVQVPLKDVLSMPINEETYERWQRHKMYLKGAAQDKADRESRVIVLGRWPIRKVGWSPLSGLFLQLDMDKEAHQRLADCQNKKGAW